MIKLVAGVSIVTALIVSGLIYSLLGRYQNSAEYHEDVILEFAATMNQQYKHKHYNPHGKIKIKAEDYSEEELEQITE